MGYLVTENGRTFDEGVAAGEIAQRLKQHDNHFSAINGSIKDLAAEMAKQTLQIQRIADEMVSDRKTVVTTASALKDAEAARREKTEVRWSPLARLAAAAAVVATLITLAALLAAHIH